MEKILQIKKLVEKLNECSDAYYLYDNPIMSDKEYDDLMDKLEVLEKETGIILSTSPLHKVQGKLLPGLDKIKHSKPMLSANKTKDMVEVGNFIIKNPTVQSWKLDGLTIVCRYEKGEFIQAITRGSGDFGEDVTEAFKHCLNFPLKLPRPIDLETRGECVISWSNFKKINEKLETPYAHPRNLAAGSVRCLDTKIAKERYLEYKVFELISIDGKHLDVLESFAELTRLGFDVVEHRIVTFDNYKEIDEKYFNPENYDFPVDGVIYKYCSYEYGEKLGTTSRFPLNMLARKWANETFETELLDIEWNTTRTGRINPTAIFKPVVIEGSSVSRATVHNVSIMEELQLGKGDTITVYKSNQIIPAIDENLTMSGTFMPPSKCPCCGSSTEIHNDNGSKTLHCTNDNCKARLISKLTHFVSRDCMNIDGLSEATLEKLLAMGWITNFADIYTLKDHAKEMQMLEGFGKKSVDKLLESIENSRRVDMAHFLNAIGIPGCGKSTSKDIANYCNGDIDRFINILSWDANEFANIDGVGRTLIESLTHWYNNDFKYHCELMEQLIFKLVEDNKKDNVNNIDLNGNTYVITGSLNHFTNRDALKDLIESLNGKVGSGITSKTTALINNDTQSTSSKNKKAKELNIPILSETQFLDMIGYNY